MGFSNGTSKAHKTVKKGQRGQRGIGFCLTDHYHIRNKRFTNVAAPVHERDATTKRFVTDLLKTKAGTTYVSNELAKKVNKSDLNVTNPFLFLKRTTHSNKNIAKFSTGLSDQINGPQINGSNQCNICSRYCIYHIKFTSYCELIECSRPIRFFIVSLMYNNSDYWSLVNGELLIKKNWGI